MRVRTSTNRPRNALAAFLLTVTCMSVEFVIVGAAPASASHPPEPLGTTTTFANDLKNPSDVTLGPDGNIWFTNDGDDSIGRITTDGTITLFRDPAFSRPHAITTGPDGFIWFASTQGIGRMSLTGVVTMFPGTLGGDLAGGPDGNVWFTWGSTVNSITPTGLVTSYDLPDPSTAMAITAGDDGNLWVALTGSVARVTPTGDVTLFPVLYSGTPVDLSDVTAGPDGNLWVTGSYFGYDFGCCSVRSGHTFGKVTPSGVVTTYAASIGPSDFECFYCPVYAGSTHIASGADGNLWLTHENGGILARGGPDGVLTTVDSAAADQLDEPERVARGELTAGSDGRVWFAEPSEDAIAAVAPDGTITRYRGRGLSHPTDLTVGPDGNLWFALHRGIGRMTTEGDVVTFTSPELLRPHALTPGPDGNVWFIETSSRRIGHITSSGVVTTFDRAGLVAPKDLVAGPDGNLWFTDFGQLPSFSNNAGARGAVGRITPDGQIITFPDARILHPNQITRSGDALWFTDTGDFGTWWTGVATPGMVARLATDGSFEAIDLTSPMSTSRPHALVAAPDGGVDVLEGTQCQHHPVTAYHVDPAGDVDATTLTVGPCMSYSQDTFLVRGPDNGLWFHTSSGLARIEPGGATHVLPFGEPGGAVAGPDGDLWVSLPDRDAIIRYGVVGPPDPPARLDVGGGGDGAATVSWTEPATHPIAPVTSLTITASPSGATCSVPASESSCVVSGMPNGSAQTFTAVATSTAGDSVPSPPTTATIGVPGRPGPPVATSYLGLADVWWTPPPQGGGPLLDVTVTASPGGKSCRAIAPRTRCAVRGLTNESAYTFTAVARNAFGDGAPSAPSNPVTPTACGGTSGLFRDVGSAHPFCADISWAVSIGLVKGYDDGTFRPTIAVSRQALAAILWRAAGSPAPGSSTSPFTDISRSHPFFAPIWWAKQQGLLTGFADATFRPTLPVSRQALAQILWRDAGEPEFIPPVTPTFTDVGATHPVRTQIEWAAANGLVTGYADGTYRPTTTVTRQAAAAILHRATSDGVL